MDTTAHELERSRTRRQRLQKRRQINGADTICEVLLVLVVVGSALAVGTVHIETLLAVSALALVGGTLGAMAFRRVPTPALVLAGLGFFSALQALPLPAGFVRWLSPATAQVWLRCLIPFGEQPLIGFPLSLDGGASITEALKWLTYAAVYVMATRVRARRGSAWLASLLFGSATLVTLITLVHGVADLDQLYGVYQPYFHAGRWNVGPLLNSNNLAGYAMLGLFAGAGLVLSGRSPVQRVPIFIALGVICTALCLSGSRAAVLSTVVCTGIAFVWLIRVQRFRLSPQRVALGVMPILAGIAVAVALGSQTDLGRLVTLDVRRKVDVWGWCLPMIRDHAWVGVGRGAFETGFPPYRQAFAYDWNGVVTHAENFIVQWIAEWGVPVGLSAVLVIGGYILLEWYGNRADRVRFLLMTGLVALMLQNLADLGLEVPAVAIAAVVALAAGERASSRPPAETEERVGFGALAFALPVLGLWVTAIFVALWPVEGERRDLSALYHELPVRSADERAQFRVALHDAVLRHPGEAFFPLLGSLVAFRSRDGNPLPWIARALELAPSNGHVHLVLAQLLGAHRANEQALLHLRLAVQYDSTLDAAAGGLAVRFAPSLEALLRAIPDGTSGDHMLLFSCAREPTIDLKIECLRRAALRNPKDATALDQLSDALLSALASGHSPCDATHAEACAQEVERTVRAMAKLQPRSWRPGYLMAKLLLFRGDVKGASQLLVRVCPASYEGTECARDAVRAAVRSGSDSAVMTAANSYAARTCDTNSSCVEALNWLGSTLEVGGKLAAALVFYTKAAEADASAVSWLKVANRAAQGHLYGIARVALERSAHSPDATPATRAEADQMMLRVAQGIGPGSN